MEKEILRIISLLKPEDINDLTLAGGKNKSFSEKIKQNQQDISKGQRKQFNLGNGQLFQDPVKAAEYLLEREYGNSFLFNDDNHDTIFIPPVFISQEYSKKTSVSVLDYKVKNDIKKSLESLQEELPKYCKTKELKELLEILNKNENNWKSAYDKWVRQMKPIYDGNEILKSDSRFKWLMESKPTDVSGEEIEHWFFDHLSSEEMKNHLKDCVILTSPTVKLSLEKKKNFHREFDFLIISWQRKLIIGIEAKRRTTKDTLTTASEQLNKCQKFFEEGFGNTLGPEEWTFFPVIFVGQCDFISNSKHFITMQSDIKHWLENVYLDYVCSSLLHTKENLKKILQIMVFTIHISRKDLKAPITTSSWVQYVTDAIFSVSTIDNIIFYSNNQLPILISDDPRYRKLFIRGGYGTGKSFLLQEKAKILAKQSEYNGRIIYFTDCDKRNLFLESLKYYLEPLGILVKSTNDGSLWESPSNPEETDAITKLITDNEIKAILIDEYDVLEQEIPFEGIKEKSNTRKGILEKLLNSTEITWIALRHTGREKDEFKEITKMNYGIHIESLELATNMRNSKEIVNYTRENDVYKGDIDYEFMSPPGNFPSGCTPVIKKNFEEALLTAKESTKGGIVVVLVDRSHENLLTFFYNIYKKGKDTVKAYMESYEHEYYTNIPFEKLKADLKKGINGNITDNEIKTFHRYISNAFKADGKNPYAFLLENSGGDRQNILVTVMSYIDGFEWNTIIFDGDKLPDQISGNKLVRCTVNIIIAEQCS